MTWRTATENDRDTGVKRLGLVGEKVGHIGTYKHNQIQMLPEISLGNQGSLNVQGIVREISRVKVLPIKLDLEAPIGVHSRAELIGNEN
ncbi:MAG: hypothetical protein WA354_18170 [Terracidiphilus sp.]